MPNRFTVETTDLGAVVLTLAPGYGRGADNEEPETRDFRIPNAGGEGYVYDTTDAPGTSGRQVCETLFGLGSTLYTREARLADAIRDLAEEHCDAIDQDGHLHA